MDVGGLDLALGEAERGEQVEARVGELVGRDAERLAKNSSPSVHLLNANLMSKAVGSAFSIFSIASAVKPFCLSVEWLMPGDWPSEPWPTA